MIILTLLHAKILRRVLHRRMSRRRRKGSNSACDDQRSIFLSGLSDFTSSTLALTFLIQQTQYQDRCLVAFEYDTSRLREMKLLLPSLSDDTTASTSRFLETKGCFLLTGYRCGRLLVVPLHHQTDKPARKRCI
jgi:hypothetical protein